MGFFDFLPIGIGTFLGGKLGADAASSASKAAAAAQLEGTKLSIEEQRRQFDEQMQEYRRKQEILEREYGQMRQDLSPFVGAGHAALFEMMALTGLQAPTPMQIAQPQRRQEAPGRMYAGGSPDFDFTGGRRPEEITLGATVEPPVAGQQNILAAQTQQDPTGIVDLLNRREELQRQRAETISPEEELRRMWRAMGLDPDVEVGQSGPGGPSAEYAAAETERLREEAGLTEEQIDEELRSIPIDLPPPTADDESDIQPITPSPYAGMTGAEAQEAAIQRISDSPLLAELTRQGEEALLQQAAATGGLRGGNIQGALAQFRPRMLQEEIDKQYSRLGGLAGTGQQSILRTPSAAVGGAPGYPTAGAAIPGMLSRIGDIGAAQAIARGQSQSDFFGGLGTALGYLGYGMMNPSQQQPQFPGISFV